LVHFRGSAVRVRVARWIGEASVHLVGDLFADVTAATGSKETEQDREYRRRSLHGGG
jgi:hypothetical protein